MFRNIFVRISSGKQKLHKVFQVEVIDCKGMGRIRGGKKEEEGYLETTKLLAPTSLHLLP